MGADRERPPHLKVYKDRHGKERIYFRRRGCASKALPGPLCSPQFWTAYQSAMATQKMEIGADRIVSGTLEELIVSYYRSADFINLRDVTKKTYRRIIEGIRKQHGEKRLHMLERRHIRLMMEAKSHAPNAANNLLKIMSILMRHAMDMEMRQDDPTHGVRKLKVPKGGHKTWSVADIDAFVERHPLGTKAYLALQLLLCTGLRRADAVRAGHQHVKDSILTIRQSKTGGVVSIPMLPQLVEAIAECPNKGLTFILTEYGKPFTPNGFGFWIKTRVEEAGLKGLSAHGLRKAAARRLAEAGCTKHEIKAITGHSTDSEVDRYTKCEPLAHGPKRNREVTALDQSQNGKVSNLFKSV